jgi:hypothetical protein
MIEQEDGAMQLPREPEPDRANTWVDFFWGVIIVLGLLFFLIGW